MKSRGSILKSREILVVLILLGVAQAAPFDFAIARVQYRGGDWDEGTTTLPNFLHYVREHLSLRIDPQEHIVSFASPHLFDYPFLFMTGHGGIRVSASEIQQLRRYLEHGGFLYLDDDFGIDKAARRFIQRLFPQEKLQLIPKNHPLFSIYYPFPQGLPKIHEHYPGAPRAYGIFLQNRLVLLYTYNTNISDGWESATVHGDPPSKREAAFQMGTNILLYAILQ